MTTRADGGEALSPAAEWQDALARVLAFARRHGPPHAALAMHAAVPLGLTPELLHLVRVNFVRRAPWIAEADLLLSPLCQDTGDGFYQMDRAVRELLVDELRRAAGFGEPALRGVAEMLLAYVERAWPAAPAGEGRSFLLAQEWTALAYLRPAEAAEALALALRQGLTGGGRADVLRVASVAEALAAPLQGEEKVLLYAAGVEKLAAGDAATAARLFGAVGPDDAAPVVGAVTLPPAAQLLRATTGGRSAAAAPGARQEGASGPAAHPGEIAVYWPRKVRIDRWYTALVFLRRGDPHDDRSEPPAGDASPESPPGEPSAEKVAEVVSNLAKAIGTIHGSSVVHRDVRPQNLVLASGESLEVKTLDLGLSGPADEDWDRQSRQILGGQWHSYRKSTLSVPGATASSGTGDVKALALLAGFEFSPSNVIRFPPDGTDRTEFRMRAGGEDRLAAGTIEVLREDTAIARIPLRVHVTAQSFPSVFICYRRSDSAHVAGRLRDRVNHHFGGAAAVLDVDSIPPGLDFRVVLAEKVARSDVVLVVIGPRWLGELDTGGRRRVDNPNDFVRVEVEAALKEGIPVVPVLVDGAAMPPPSALPDSLRGLAERQACPLRGGPDFEHDLGRLIEVLERFGEAPAPEPERIANPFRLMPVEAGSAPFVDREEVAREIERAVLAPDPARLILLSAPRRMGRTSLLLSLPRLLSPRIVVTYADCQATSGAPEEVGPRLWIRLTRAITQGLAHRGLEIEPPSSGGREGDAYAAFTRWLRWVERGLPSVGRADDAFTAFTRWLQWVERGLPADVRLLLCLDESEYLDVVVTTRAADFVHAFAVLLDACPRLTLLFAHAVGNVEPAIAQGLGSAVTIRLGPLSRHAVGALLELAGSEPDSTYAAGVGGAVYEATGGHPFLVQALASTLVDLLNEQGRAQATAEDVALAGNIVIDQHSHSFFFRGLWDQAGEGGRTVLRALAKGETGVGGAAVRDHLQALGFLTPEGNFAVPLFPRWMRSVGEA